MNRKLTLNCDQVYQHAVSLRLGIYSQHWRNSGVCVLLTLSVLQYDVNDKKQLASGREFR